MPHISVIILAIIITIIILCTWRYKRGATTNIYKQWIYLDNNATMPPDDAVLSTVSQHSYLGNASSDYAIQAKLVRDLCDFQINSWLGATGRIIYTSGASESNNLFIRGIIDTYWLKFNKAPHFIMSAIEHKTSVDCLRQLAKLSRVNATFINPHVDGQIDPIELGYAIQPETVAISIMHVNNETGAANNISNIAELAHRRGIIFHCDIVQSFGKYEDLMSHPGVAAVSISFHKLGGPTGIGALVLRDWCAGMLSPQICGTQNYGLRGGTDNISGIAGALKAMQIAFHERHEKNAQIAHMRHYIVNRLRRAYQVGDLINYIGRDDNYSPAWSGVGRTGEIVFIGPQGGEDTSVNTIMVSFVKFGPMIEHFCNIALKRTLLEKGIIVSIGSACNANEPSHVLVAMRAPFIIRCGVIRISLGENNSMDDCRKFCDQLIGLVRF